MESDLSEYEKLRLSNIKKNEEFLQALGLVSIRSQSAKVQSSEVKRKSPSHTRTTPKEPAVGWRRSKRLKSNELKESDGSDHENDLDEENPIVKEDDTHFYETMPEVK